MHTKGKVNNKRNEALENMLPPGRTKRMTIMLKKTMAVVCVD